MPDLANITTEPVRKESAQGASHTSSSPQPRFPVNNPRYDSYFGQKFSFSFILKFIYLFLAALGLRCCAWAFSSCGERGLLFAAVSGLLIGVASLVAEHRLQERRLQ